LDLPEASVHRLRKAKKYFFDVQRAKYHCQYAIDAAKTTFSQTNHQNHN